MLPGYVWTCSWHLHQYNNLFSVITETAQLDYCVQVNMDTVTAIARTVRGVLFLGFLWRLISIHGPRRKKASSQGSWEKHWATFPTFGPGLGTLKGTDTRSSLLHLPSVLISFSLSLSVPPLLPFTKRRNGNSSRVNVYEWRYFLPH